LAAASATFFVNTAHVFRTSKFRKLAQIKYPTTYATDELAAKDTNAYRFNCAQRAHANYTENLTTLLGSMLITGLNYPVFAASLGAAWATGRLAYLYGYTSDKGPAGRTPGAVVASLSLFTLQIAAAVTSYKFIFSQ
ncbi:hypothetical protein Golomagni_08159, partial [Golovinomyces magnicellulatus]